jgi:hypothetical protein
MVERLDATFHALADSTRRGMLADLALGEKSVGELARPFAMSFAGAASRYGQRPPCEEQGAGPPRSPSLTESFQKLEFQAAIVRHRDRGG